MEPNKMKIHIIIFCCLCRGFDSVTVRSPSGKEYKDSLKDIRLVTGHTTASFQKPIVITNQNEYSKSTRSPEPKVTRQILRKSEEKKKVSEARFDDSQTDSQAQMQKIANQLYLAQKRASLLSDYQKFILSQDVNVKNYVLGPSVQSRSPKPFSPRKPHGRSLTPKAKHVTVKPTAAESISLGKIVVVTPKSQTAVEKISKPQNDHKTQGSHIKYVTLAPQFVESHEPGQKVTLLPYHTPQPHAYYDLGATSKPQVETVQIPATAPFGSYKAPQLHYHHDENEHELKGNYENSKYEFMYKVKDHAKNSHFGHKESRSDKTTYGYYFVQLPDGRLETVRYWADKTGYHAKVDYQGEAKHPIHAFPEGTMNCSYFPHARRLGQVSLSNCCINRRLQEKVFDWESQITYNESHILNSPDVIFNPQNETEEEWRNLEVYIFGEGVLLWAGENDPLSAAPQEFNLGK